MKTENTIAELFRQVLEPFLNQIVASVQQTQVQEQALDVDQVADFLGVGKAHIYRMVRTKKIPYHKIGKFLRFYLSEIKSATKV